MHKVNHIGYVNDYKNTASAYASAGIVGDIYLAYRDVPSIINTYVLNNQHINKFAQKRVLDYGCGAGRSTKFLKKVSSNFIVDGVDINNSMLAEARISDPEGNYIFLKNETIPIEDNHYDFAFSSFVLFEIESKSKMKHVLKEIKRVLKSGSIFIAITGTTDLYDTSNQWVSLNTNFPENMPFISGKKMKLYLKEANIEIYDIYWTPEDYAEVFKESGMKVIKAHYPIGSPSDAIEWKSETKVAPFVAYILST